MPEIKFKLTLVAIGYRGRTYSKFLMLPVGTDGKVRFNPKETFPGIVPDGCGYIIGGWPW